MCVRRPFRCMAAAMLFSITPAVQPQTFTSILAIPLDTAGPVIQAHVEPLKPFTVAGERGVVLGQQDGAFEAWVLPVKLLSHLTIEAEVQGYSVPIDVNQQAAEIEVRPDRTVITYAHIAFTVRQIMFSPDEASVGTGPMVLFEFDCLRPTDFTLRFTPELRWMWPERNEGVPGAEWVSAPGGAGGYYVLHSDYPDLAGAVTIPGAKPGILAPYQERPQVHPVELKLHIDPARDHGRLFPLLMAAGMTPAAARTPALGAALAQLNDSIAASYQTHAGRYRKLLASATTIETPDKALNEAFQWAVVSIEQLKAHPIGPVSGQDFGSVSGHDLSLADTAPKTGEALAPADETALVAGYYASGDSARPGFGWFFGRDSLYTLYAVNGYGDFALSKAELEFLIHRQRADGKIMHEYSQTAAAIDWQAYPYMYAAADSTPLFLLAVEDYVRASGDTGFLKANREAIEKAWAFETDPAHDTDHDGIYDNSQGTGWVESWPGGMPHQEIYLALLDEQASGAMAGIEKLLGDSARAATAQQRADKIGKTIETEYYDPEKSCYAFSHNPDGSQDRTSTVYPALAWWSDKSVSGSIGLAHPDGCLQELAAHTLNTDWGLRDVANDEKIYDGMSYHQGSVWPLFTGWAALAEYRAGQPLAGYQMLMENANLTWAQDLGADTELLSGDFYVPFGRSTSHQLWSSAMVITPTLRGLFGISIDAQTKTITVNPHLPADWRHAEVKNLRVGNSIVDLSFTQTKNEILTWIKPIDSGITLRHGNSEVRRDQAMSISMHPVEVIPVSQRPLPGDSTRSQRILNEDYGDRRLTLTIEGLSGTEVPIPLVLTTANLKLQAEGAELHSTGDQNTSGAPVDGSILIVRLPPGEGWKTIIVTLTW
jgi:glycogen debranching enzyme